jgi:hypothetical protein
MQLIHKTLIALLAATGLCSNALAQQTQSHLFDITKRHTLSVCPGT